MSLVISGSPETSSMDSAASSFPRLSPAGFERLSQRLLRVPIELIDGEKLVEMFKKFELGLRPVTTYEIVESFFEEFKS